MEMQGGGGGGGALGAQPARRSRRSDEACALHSLGQAPALPPAPLLLTPPPCTPRTPPAPHTHPPPSPANSLPRFVLFCRTLVGLAPRDARLYAYVGTEMLRGAVGCLASEFMAKHQSDVLALIRDVLAQQLGDAGSGAAGVLASLPNMTPGAVDALRAALGATGSEKAQRDAIKRLLVRWGVGGWRGVGRGGEEGGDGRGWGREARWPGAGPPLNGPRE